MTKGIMADLQRIRAMPAIPPTINLSYDIGDANSLRQVFIGIENIVKRILESELDDLEHEFKRSLHFFRPEFEKLNKILIMQEKESQLKGNNIDVVQNIAVIESQIFQLLKEHIQAKNLNEDISRNILEIVNNLSDYENILLGIIIRRSNKLPKAIREIDVEDLITNIVGAYQAFYCILYMIGHQENYDSKRLSKLITLGTTFSKEMDSYADTLDILTDPDEVQAIKNSKEYYNAKPED
jgi:hypothetical protein